MDSPNFCLKWNNFQTNLLSAFGSLYSSEELADVTIYCESSSVKAHKLILSACSAYFRSVFKEHPTCIHPIIILKGITADDLSSALTFMYQGEVNIPKNRLPDFMRTAKFLQIRGLIDSDSVHSSEILKHKLDVDDIPCKRARANDVYSEPTNDKTETDNEPETFIKQEIKTEREDTSDGELNELMDGEHNMETEDSILHRSLKGDHTVKPAESLIITPDLPMSISQTTSSSALMNNTPPLTTVAYTSDNSATNTCNASEQNMICNTQPPPLVPLKCNVKVRNTLSLMPSLAHIDDVRENECLKDDEGNDAGNDNEYEQLASPTFEEKLSSTLKSLKNNPHISILSESVAENGSGAGCSIVQPQISIEPMVQLSETDASNYIKMPSSILEQNLKKSKMLPKKPCAAINKSAIKFKSEKTALEALRTKLMKTGNSAELTGTQILSNNNIAPGKSSMTIDVDNMSANVANVTQSWNCPHCSSVYHNQSALKYHVRLVHSDLTNRLCCYLCPNSFTMRESYKIHMLDVHGIRH